MTDDHKSESAVLSKSKVFKLDEFSMRTMPNGGKSWDFMRGMLVTGERIGVHQSMQPAGLPPNPPHKIAHSEFIFVREGALEFQYEGKSERVSAGGVIFVALGTMHTARNVGDGPATYLVISVGGDTR
jgi:mannose-6-phosphate isomerase-like protein (cupin superfamily)